MQVKFYRLTVILVIGFVNSITLLTSVKAQKSMLKYKEAFVNTKKIKQGESSKFQNLEIFVMPSEYSIRYPKGWFVDISVSGKEPRGVKPITIYDKQIYNSSRENELIKLITTSIYPVSVSFEQTIQESKNQSFKIMRQGYTKIGGKEAYRIWNALDSKTDGRYEITTLIRHPNETMVISSLYFPGNAGVAVPIIQKIHGSYRSLRP